MVGEQTALPLSAPVYVEQLTAELADASSVTIEVDTGKHKGSYRVTRSEGWLIFFMPNNHGLLVIEPRHNSELELFFSAICRIENELSDPKSKTSIRAVWYRQRNGSFARH